MKNTQKYRKLYLEQSQESFEKWGYYYPPRNWEEFEKENIENFEKYLTIERFKEEQTAPDIQVKLYLSLLGDHFTHFGFFTVFENNYFEEINDVIFQTSRNQLLHRATLASGTDHCLSLMDVLSAFSCNDFEIIDSFFPKNLFSEGVYFSSICVNLLTVMYYKQDDLAQEALQRADKFLEKKNTTWDKNIVLYFLALYHRNVNEANEALQNLCTAYQKMEHSVMSIYNKMEKCFATEVHGLYRLAKLIDEEFFENLTMPKHHCFFQEFELWHKENNYPKGKVFYTYPQEMDYLNRIYKAKIPKVTLKKYKSTPKLMKDVERFAQELAESVALVSASENLKSIAKNTDTTEKLSVAQKVLKFFRK